MGPSWRARRWGQGILASIPLLLQYVCSAGAASPIEVAFNGTAGPDGPWNVIQQKVDYPDQTIQMLPSLTNSSVLVPATACQAKDAQCPLPLPGMWTQSGAQSTLSYGDGQAINASTSLNSPILNLTGNATHMLDRITFDGSNGAEFLVDNHGFVVAENFTLKYPGGSSYTMDTGFLSLNGQSNEQTWILTNGSSFTANRTLPGAYIKGYIPSISYGLHVGSAEPNVSGSLLLGGYDSSRIIGDIISGDASTGENIFTLDDIFLGVTSGGSAFLPDQASNISGLIDPNTPQRQISVKVDPGVPYMYLPGATCKAITDHLPVKADSDTGLYRWRAGNLSYTDIVQSPHYLGFRFGATTISIPFALLNLTMESPIVQNSWSYFPCNSYNPKDTTYVLGRAFLQGAFLGQNWQSGGVWLAQAPGPDGPSSNTKTINTGDSSISGIANPPAWNDTWSSVLKPLATNTTLGSGESSSGLSSGAKIGIGVGVGVGVVALIAAIGGFLFFRKRKKSRYDAVEGNQGHELEGRQPQGRWAMHEQKPPAEMDTTQPVAELPVQQVQEMDASEPWKRDKPPGEDRYV